MKALCEFGNKSNAPQSIKRLVQAIDLKGLQIFLPAKDISLPFFPEISPKGMEELAITY